MSWKLLASVAVVVATAAVPVSAHHSFSAEFDITKPFKLTGVVTKLQWANPHTFFYLDVTDEKTGKVTNWAFEMGNPNALARDGTPYGNARVVLLSATGQRLFAGSSQGQP